jgi:hypothetical protein
VTRLIPCLLWLAIMLVGCGPNGQEPAIGEGFVAPATLNLRKDLGPQQPSVTTVRHGERLEILARKRRFVKARTGSGAVGWTDGDLLFGPEKMEELRALARQAAALPSQGQATVLDALNIHVQPGRETPSFDQIQEGGNVDVVAHRLVSVPPRLEDWSLVRASATKAGWVLMRNLVMAIPDEVAQYAEGQRITSYFALGEVQDGGQVKRNWLWTTIAKGQEAYQFDTVRVFTWSLRRQRYETAFIERKLKGYYPVEVQGVSEGSPAFSILVEDKDGAHIRRAYKFEGNHVRLVSTTPWTPTPEEAAASGTEKKPPAAAPQTLWGRFSQGAADLRRRVFGK